MNERIKQIRQHFQQTQKDFGISLGVSRDTFASYESGRVIPSNTFVQLLCSMYVVNEDWLRTGNGEMFSQESLSFVEKLSDEFKLSMYGRKMIECYLELDERQQSTIDQFLRSFVESCTSGSPAANSGISPDIAEVKLEENINLYRAANSESNAAPEIIQDDTGKIEKFKALPKVTKADDL